jgi:LCP family protein required for cell wall assembly
MMDGIRRKNNPPQPNFKSAAKPEPRRIFSGLPKKSATAIRQPVKNPHFWRHLFQIIGLLFLFLIVSYGSFFSWKVVRVSTKITASSDESDKNESIFSNVQSVVKPMVTDSRKILKGEDEGRINLLLLGAAGSRHPGKNLTDTIMMMSIDTKNKKLALMSLPRDLFVNIPDTKIHMKINSIYQYGLNNDEGLAPLISTVEKISGQKIQYYLVADFDGFIKIVDDLGGINVEVERDIYDARYPGPNYSYETFELKKGLQHLDGAIALKYVRERHDDPEGDFGRAKRQQQVMQSVKNKAFSLGTFFNPFRLNDLLTNLGDNIRTNIGFDEIGSFVALSRVVDTQNISNAVVDAWKKESLLKVSHINSGEVRAFILVPRVGNFSEVQDLAENIFDREKIEKRREEIAGEAARIVVINRSADHRLGMEIKKTLKDKLGMEDVMLISEKKSNQEEKTRVIDYTNGGKIFTLDELLKKLPAELAQGGENGVELEEESDLIVVIGNDLVDPYSYEENSLEELDSAENQNDYLEITK